MNADAILITWGICLVVVIVIVLAEAIRGDEQRRDDDKVTMIIEAKDTTGPEFRKAFEGMRALAKELPAVQCVKTRNKEGTDGETNLCED